MLPGVVYTWVSNVINKLTSVFHASVLSKHRLVDPQTTLSMLWRNSLSITGQTPEKLTINWRFFTITNCQIVLSRLLTRPINCKFMCLSAYWQWELANEHARISTLIVIFGATSSSNQNYNQHTFAGALPQQHAFTSSFDWLTGLSVSFVIGQSDFFGIGFAAFNWKLLWAYHYK